LKKQNLGNHHNDDSAQVKSLSYNSAKHCTRESNDEN
jgi:hypothetical protein